MVIYKVRKSIRYGLDRRYWIDGWFSRSSGMVSSGKTYLGGQEGRWCECTYLHTDRNFAHAVAYIRDIDECNLDYRCQHCSAGYDPANRLRSLEDTVRLEDLGYFHLLSGYFYLLPAPYGRRMELGPYRSART